MKIAMLISGRAARYENCLLPILENTPYDIDLYMSINDEECMYYTIMKDKLKKWLKGIYIKPYIIPDDFHNKVDINSYRIYQKINDKWVPRNQLSMYWNDTNAFNMACDYSKSYNFEYDIFMRFRSDIFNLNIPILTVPDPNIPLLYSIKPLCNFISFGIHPVEIISSDWVWGNKLAMSVYCNTYTYVLNKNKELNNNYIIHFESNHTDNIIENNIPYSFVNVKYNIDINRKLFDKEWKKDENGIHNDTRPKFINSLEYIDIKTISTINIDLIPE